MAARQRPAMSFPKPTAPAVREPERPPGGAIAERSPSRAGRKAITFYVEPDVWERTRVLAIRQKRTTQAMLEELVTRYLEGQGQ